MAKNSPKQNQTNSWFYEALQSNLSEFDSNITQIGTRQEFDYFFGKHSEFFQTKFSLKKIGNIGKNSQGNDFSKKYPGTKINGYLKISEDGFFIWIDPEVRDSGVVFGMQQEQNNKTKMGVSDSSREKESLLTRVVDSIQPIRFTLSVPANFDSTGVFIIEFAYSVKNTLIPIHLESQVGKNALCTLALNYSSVESEKTGKSIILNSNQFLLEENASMNVFSNQAGFDQSALFFDERITQGKDSHLEFFVFEQGGAIVDRTFSVDMTESGAESLITGLYQPGIGARYYYDTKQNHLASNTVSDLQFKGVLGKESFASWKGNIVVEVDTTGTNGYQANNNLIMDDSAKVESVPGLEIMADDVSCSHGVTIGNIDENHLFYLQSRGIDKDEAEKLIMDGFLTSAKRRIKNSVFNKIISHFL